MSTTKSSYFACKFHSYFRNTFNVIWKNVASQEKYVIPNKNIAASFKGYQQLTTIFLSAYKLNVRQVVYAASIFSNFSEFQVQIILQTQKKRTSQNVLYFILKNLLIMKRLLFQLRWQTYYRIFKKCVIFFFNLRTDQKTLSQTDVNLLDLFLFV